ncbi:MAG: hypothetical protein Q9224_002922 [Gallowayella concinna]
MRRPPNPVIDESSEASDSERETTSRSGTTSPDGYTIVVNVDQADTEDTSVMTNSANWVQARMAQLDLSRRGNSGLETPSTARDLYDATPGASPSPKPRHRGEKSDLELSSGESNGNQLADYAVTAMQRLCLDTAPRQYSIKDEALPLEPYFDQEFQNCLKTGKAIAGAVCKDLSTCSLATQSNTELGRLRAVADRLSSFESPATRFVGIVGDSAAGKSSLINSLLDHPDLAHKGDHGSAVTSFVTEYHRRSPYHSAPFTIEVEYCNPEEIDEQLHELLVSYRELYQPGLEKELENNEQLYREIETKSGVAASTLESIFPKRPEVTPIHLRDESEGAFERIYGELKRLAALIEWPSGAVNGKWEATASSASECHDKVAHFMEQGLWPLTNIVRIYLSAQVLKTGVVLADLPGYRDINLARVRKAEQYLLRCHEVFIVANINRVISDQSVAKFVGDQMRASGKRKSITIDMDLPAAAKKYKGVASSKAGKVACRNRENAWGPNGSAASAQVADTEYKYLFVSARNIDVKKALRSRYAGMETSLSINVFCIGNRDYEGAEYRSKEAHERAIQGSCIPDLRRFCHSIVASAQYRASVHFLEVELPSLIQSLEVWLSVSEQKALTTIDPRIIRGLQSELEQKIDDFAEALEDAILTHVLDYMSRHARASNDHALEMSEEWTGWHWTSYKAFCRQNGDHCTGAIGSRSWNAELLGHMNVSMTDHWPELQGVLTTLDRQLQTSVANACRTVRAKLKDLNVPNPLLASFRLKERELNYLLKDVCFETRREVQNIEFNAMGHHISSYILNLMIPTYRACAAENGKGTMARMHQTMRRRLGRRDLFTLIGRRVETETSELFDREADSVRNHTIEMCEAIKRQVKTFNGPEAEARRRNPVEVKKVRGLAETARAKNLALQKALKDIKRSQSVG